MNRKMSAASTNRVKSPKLLKWKEANPPSSSPNPSSSVNPNNNNSSVAPASRPPFDYPDLPKWETGLHYFICACMFITCWSAVGYYSTLMPKRLLLEGVRFAYEKLPLLNIYRHRDYCDFEWNVIFAIGYKWAAALTGHSIVLEIADRFLGGRREEAGKKDNGGSGKDQAVKLIVILYSLIAFLFTFRSVKALAIFLVEAAGVFVVCKLFRYQIVPWILVAALYHLNNEQMKADNLKWDDFNRISMELSVQQYSLFQYVSYCVAEIILNPTEANFGSFLFLGISLRNQVINYFFYLLYYPYKMYLIMPYRLFEKRWRERNQTQQRRDWKRIISYGLRVWFWAKFSISSLKHPLFEKEVSSYPEFYAEFYVCEYCCFFFYHKSIILYLNQYPVNVRTSLTFLCCCYFAMGNFFHMKYFVIFGLPSVFLEIDRMQPLPPPICVARVSLYSRMWREFDRGLYLFLKHCVYKPICQPTFSVQRKLIAGITAFTVVLIWHTSNKAMTAWILLNLSVLAMKGVGILAYNSSDQVYKFCHQTLSPVNLRRFVVILQIPLVILSVDGLAYFLAGAPQGDEFSYYLIWDAWWLNPGRKILAECAMAYSFGQCCISCNKWWAGREARRDKETVDSNIDKNVQKMKKK